MDNLIVLKLHFSDVYEFAQFVIAYAVPCTTTSYFDGEATITVQRSCIQDILLELPVVHDVFEVTILLSDH